MFAAIETVSLDIIRGQKALLCDKYKYYVVINILFKLNMTSIKDTYFLVKFLTSQPCKVYLDYRDSRCPDFVGVMQVLFYLKEMLYAVRCLKSNQDMILTLAGQFK